MSRVVETPAKRDLGDGFAAMRAGQIGMATAKPFSTHEIAATVIVAREDRMQIAQ